MERIKLQGLESWEYEHPLDNSTLETLKKTPLFPKILELTNVPMNSLRRYNLLGSLLRVNENQLPKLYNIFRTACDILCVNEPLFYIDSNPEINAYTVCSDKPIVVLHGYLLDTMDDNELMFVIGHELAHIKSNHVLYKQLGFILQKGILNSIISSIPGVGLFSDVAIMSLNYAYSQWVRAGEFTSDRGGYLACQDFTVSCSALMKLAGYSKRFAHTLSLGEFIEQGRAFETLDTDALGKIQKIILSYSQTHPWTVSRVHELIGFNESGNYSTILQRKSERGTYKPANPVSETIAPAVSQVYDQAKSAANNAIKGFTEGFIKFMDNEDKEK
jgi:Zn-dependent protease with chaperone function